jgi:hypothetical protein
MPMMTTATGRPWHQGLTTPASRMDQRAAAATANGEGGRGRGIAHPSTRPTDHHDTESIKRPSPRIRSSKRKKETTVVVVVVVMVVVAGVCF